MTNQERLASYMKVEGRRLVEWMEIHQGNGDCELSQPGLRGHSAYMRRVHGHGYPVTARQRKRLLRHASSRTRDLNTESAPPDD